MQEQKSEHEVVMDKLAKIERAIKRYKVDRPKYIEDYMAELSQRIFDQFSLEQTLANVDRKALNELLEKLNERLCKN